MPMLLNAIGIAIVHASDLNQLKCLSCTAAQFRNGKTKRGRKREEGEKRDIGAAIEMSNKTKNLIFHLKRDAIVGLK